MAGYERNPKLQRRLAVLLVVAETLALTGNFSVIFLAYANYLSAGRSRRGAVRDSHHDDRGHGPRAGRRRP